MGKSGLSGNPATFTDAQWASAFATATPLPFAQRVAFWAGLASHDAVYALGPLGEGAGSQPDPGPLHNFQHVDCVTYVEQVYALALSHSRAQFDDVLRRIRYRDGQVDFRWRNHYTISDWLPANGWFIRDITAHVGTGVTRAMTKTIARAQFFAGKGLPQYADIPDETSTTSYIPREQAPALSGKLHTGDLIIFVVSTPGIIAGHVGLIKIEHGIAYVEHASMSAKRVVTAPLFDYLRNMPARFIGCKIARVNE